ncbi:hypothetical protein BJY52DRAFT_1232596, partial [Lactarius psammicola]
AAEELGYVLISKDDAEECEGRMAKCHAGPVGKQDHSSSRAGLITLSEVPATPENQLRKLDTLQTPKAQMLNALQANLMTLFTVQINLLSSCIDAQDEMIKIKQPIPKGKGKQAQAQPPLPAAPSSTPPVDPSPPANEVLPVLDPTPVPRPPPIPPRSTRPPRAILPEKATWAGVVTPANFEKNQMARNASRGNANIIGRTAGGATQKGKASAPVSLENTEITIACGEGLTDKAAEERLYKSNHGSIVQAACSAMERMSAQAPPILYGQWPWSSPWDAVTRYPIKGGPLGSSEAYPHQMARGSYTNRTPF